MKTLFGIITTAAVLLSLAVVMPYIYVPPRDTSMAPVASAPARAGPVMSGMTAAEHLAAAKKAMDDPRNPNAFTATLEGRQWYGNNEALMHLGLITDKDAEYPEAQRLVSTVRARAAFNAMSEQANARAAAAMDIERAYLRKGLDVHVSVEGHYNTTLKMSYVLMSRPLAFQIRESKEFTEAIARAGFTKVVLTNGLEGSLAFTDTLSY